MADDASLTCNLNVVIVISDVLPVYFEAHDFVTEQRVQQYNDMVEALRVMGRVNSETPVSELHLRLYLLNMGSLPFDESKLVRRTS